MAVQKVAIAIHDGVQALDVAGPVDVFAEANAYIPAEDRYETVLVAAHRAPLRASNNMQMVADLSFEEASDGFDLLLVAGYAAGMLLEGSDRALKAVAYDCGFGTADRMRIVFSEQLGVTPAQYRASFRQSKATCEASGHLIDASHNGAGLKCPAAGRLGSIRRASDWIRRPTRLPTGTRRLILSVLGERGAARRLLAQRKEKSHVNGRS